MSQSSNNQQSIHYLRSECLYCGIEFDQPTKGHWAGKKIFCSLGCCRNFHNDQSSKKIRSQKFLTICARCGGNFRPYGNKKYCCRAPTMWKRSHRILPFIRLSGFLKPTPCERCGEIMEGRRRRFCSFRCYKSNIRKPMLRKNCVQCGKSFLSARPRQRSCISCIVARNSKRVVADIPDIAGKME